MIATACPACSTGGWCPGRIVIRAGDGRGMGEMQDAGWKMRIATCEMRIIGANLADSPCAPPLLSVGGVSLSSRFQAWWNKRQESREVRSVDTWEFQVPGRDSRPNGPVVASSFPRWHCARPMTSHPRHLGGDSHCRPASPRQSITPSQGPQPPVPSCSQPVSGRTSGPVIRSRELARPMNLHRTSLAARLGQPDACMPPTAGEGDEVTEVRAGRAGESLPGCELRTTHQTL